VSQMTADVFRLSLSKSDLFHVNDISSGMLHHGCHMWCRGCLPFRSIRVLSQFVDGVRVARSLVFLLCFVDSFLSFLFWPLCCLSFFFWPLCCLSFFFWPLCCLSFFFWPLCCLSFFDLRLRITPLVSSNFS
jgi:hypothetical protein